MPASTASVAAVVDTITIDGSVLSLDELIDEYGLAIEPPYSDADLAAITEAIDEANAEANALEVLLSAVVILALLPRSRPSGVAFVDRRLQYVEDGRAISETRIRLRIRRQQQRSSQQLERISQDLIDGQISPEQWQRRMARHIVNDHIRMMQVGAGTRSRVNQRHIAELQKRLWNDEYGGALGSLDRLSRQLQNGEISEKMLLYRSRMLGLNTRATYEGARQANFRNGEWLGRRFLDPSAQHCPDCPAHQRTEWVAASEIVPVGAQCRCGGRCRCRTEFRRVNLSDALPVA